MTEREAVNVNVGDSLYIVVMSNPVQMHNPFLRTMKNRHTSYRKPLGIFKTTLISKDEDKSVDSSYEDCCGKTHTIKYRKVSGKIDTKPFKHLLLPEGRYDKIPDGMHKYNYTDCSCDWFVAMDDIRGRTPNASFVENMFLTENEAKDYYNKHLKAFKRNVKTFVAHLESEAENGQRLIDNARAQIREYKHVGNLD